MNKYWSWGLVAVVVLLGASSLYTYSENRILRLEKELSQKESESKLSELQGKIDSIQSTLNKQSSVPKVAVVGKSRFEKGNDCQNMYNTVRSKLSNQDFTEGKFVFTNSLEEIFYSPKTDSCVYERAKIITDTSTGESSALLYLEDVTSGKVLVSGEASGNTDSLIAGKSQFENKVANYR